MQQRISLKVDGKVKDIFNIGYTSDGGFFFQDRIRINFSETKCLVVKVKSDVNNHGIVDRKIDYSAYTNGDVKIAHHLDGNSQVSGAGVVSGYDESGNPKGASIKSFQLTGSNDGGPFWTMSLWGFDLLRDSLEKTIVLLPDDRYVHSSHDIKELNNYEIKAFYLLKEWLTAEQLSQTTIIFSSPVEGPVELTLVPSSSKCLGIIGLLAARGLHGFKSSFGFCMSGAPSKVDALGFCDFLSIIYPAVEMETETENLDFM